MKGNIYHQIPSKNNQLNYNWKSNLHNFDNYNFTSSLTCVCVVSYDKKNWSFVRRIIVPKR